MFFSKVLLAFAALASSVIATPQDVDAAAVSTCAPQVTVTQTYVSYITVYPTSTEYSTLPGTSLPTASAPWYPTGPQSAPWGTTGTGTGYYYPTGTGYPTTVPPPFYNGASSGFNGNAVVAALVAVGAIAALL